MTAVSTIWQVFQTGRENMEGDADGNSSYLTTIEQDIFDTFRYLPHAVAVGVGFVTVAAAWKNQQMIKKQNGWSMRMRFLAPSFCCGFW